MTRKHPGQDLEAFMHGIPNWCHHHGVKMRITRINLHNHEVVIAGSTAKVTITKSPYSQFDAWFVEWEIVQSTAYREEVRGRIRFSSDDLAEAFGLSESSGKNGGWLRDRFQADCAEQGKYIRRGDFLNIPCPGTGNDGDPNISICLDDEIKDTIRQLLGK